MTSPTPIACDGLGFAFPDETAVLEGVSFEVKPREAVALLGENGAGKSTLLHLCLGYLAPTAGRLRVLGEDPVAASNRLRAAVAYVPETARLYPSMTGLQVIDFFGRLAGARATATDRDGALSSVGFPFAALERPTATYSKGMRQKIVLALGLLKRARLFLLDEPTSGLDPQSRRDLAVAVEALAGGGAAVLFTTHDNDLVEAASTRSLSLEDGSLLERSIGG
jgi:ABC-2 type transport system ATP-binding protein